jgi:hypothetical protein
MREAVLASTQERQAAEVLLAEVSVQGPQPGTREQASFQEAEKGCGKVEGEAGQGSRRMRLQALPKVVLAAGRRPKKPAILLEGMPQDRATHLLPRRDQKKESRT